MDRIHSKNTNTSGYFSQELGSSSSCSPVDLSCSSVELWLSEQRCAAKPGQAWSSATAIIPPVIKKHAQGCAACSRELQEILSLPASLLQTEEAAVPRACFLAGQRSSAKDELFVRSVMGAVRKERSPLRRLHGARDQRSVRVIRRQRQALRTAAAVLFAILIPLSILTVRELNHRDQQLPTQLSQSSSDQSAKPVTSELDSGLKDYLAFSEGEAGTEEVYSEEIYSSGEDASSTLLASQSSTQDFSPHLPEAFSSKPATTEGLGRSGSQNPVELSAKELAILNGMPVSSPDLEVDIFGEEVGDTLVMSDWVHGYGFLVSEQLAQQLGLSHEGSIGERLLAVHRRIMKDTASGDAHGSQAGAQDSTPASPRKGKGTQFDQWVPDQSLPQTGPELLSF